MNSLSTDFKIQDGSEILESQPFKTWLTNISRVVKPQDGLCALLDSVASINTVFSRAFANSHEEKVNSIGLALKQTICMTSIIGLIGDLEWWICQKANSRQERISMCLFTALKCARVFLEFSYFSLDKINLSIGRVSLIDLVLNVLNIGALVFSLWHNRKEWEKADSQVKANASVLAKIENEDRSNLVGIRQWKKIHQNDKLAKGKIWMAIAMDTANIAVSVLALVISFTSLSVNHIVGTGMIFLGIGTSGFWLYKCYYEEKNRDVQIYMTG